VAIQAGATERHADLASWTETRAKPVDRLHRHRSQASDTSAANRTSWFRDSLPFRSCLTQNCLSKSIASLETSEWSDQVRSRETCEESNRQMRMAPNLRATAIRSIVTDMPIPSDGALGRSSVKSFGLSNGHSQNVCGH
jgi:hypothetical protein